MFCVYSRMLLILRCIGPIKIIHVNAMKIHCPVVQGGTNFYLTPKSRLLQTNSTSILYNIHLTFLAPPIPRGLARTNIVVSNRWLLLSGKPICNAQLPRTA